LLGPNKNGRTTYRRSEETVRPSFIVGGAGGKKNFVNPLTTYPENLEKVNDSLRKQGKPTILIQSADESLMDEDLLEMVNAGLIPATVTTTDRATLWSEVLPNITPYPKLVNGNEG
jgi:membrane-bound lytic murein transglycosylase MltF